MSTLGLAASLGFDYTDEYALIANNTYHYLRAEPDSHKKYAGTAFLVHGWPDMAYGWHNQISLLTSMGYRVIAPNMLGFGQSSRPVSVDPYAQKNVVSDLAELFQTVLEDREKGILVGHDWGAVAVWGLVVRHPQLFSAVINLAVPLFTPAPKYLDLADAIEAGQRTFQGYVLQLRQPGMEERFRGADKFRHMLRAVFEGTTADGQPGVNNTNGFNFDLLDQMQVAPFLPRDLEDIYVREMTSHYNLPVGLFNPYRTARLDWEDDITWQNNGGSWQIDIPSLFICGRKDQFVPCQVAEGMERNFKDLQKFEVDSGHWIQIEAHDKVNDIIQHWIGSLKCHKQ
ncbi:unnamed protein product [Clonostachys rhizophaga]|uniref:AB hydrolase-1 domain-containing protein n=1 Tax=Clonostachys rhizophaga TaxID=160324 RepID=A0A9N9V794_9HYPO|nr:unnamed protein product [Clonostachys rhizophaga]